MTEKTNNTNQNEILREERQILKEEKEILAEVKKEETALKKLTKNIWVTSLLGGVIILSIVIGIVYWQISSQRVYTDSAIISAPVTNLTPSVSGVLNNVFVNVGDQVLANTVVAQVGNELLKVKDPSQIISVNKSIGTIFNPGQTVVGVINPTDLRLVAHIDEDKGLSDIHVGEQAIFTVDAYGSTKFQGIVDEISPTARQGDIVFNISDKRQINQFDVKVRFDTSVYPNLKNGMSAKVWIYR